MDQIPGTKRPRVEGGSEAAAAEEEESAVKTEQPPEVKDEMKLSQKNASGPEDIAGRLKDAEEAIRALTAAFNAERTERKQLSELLDEMVETVHKQKKRLKRSEAEVEELREYVTQLAQDQVNTTAIALSNAGLTRGIAGAESLAVSSSRAVDGTKRKKEVGPVNGMADQDMKGSPAGKKQRRERYAAVLDPYKVITDEDKQRIRSNINRLPPERMPPLVTFVQGQLPTMALVLENNTRIAPNEIEVDIDMFDNRTLRTIDYKVRQAIALAGQARRRAERRLLEQQLEQEAQQRASSVGGMELGTPSMVMSGVNQAGNPER